MKLIIIYEFHVSQAMAHWCPRNICPKVFCVAAGDAGSTSNFLDKSVLNKSVLNKLNTIG